jgi:murein DD-endopeptidase MepM/ murein hydrolase activator NlpD
MRTQESDMSKKVVNYDELIAWANSNAYEPIVEPPIDPPVEPDDDFHDLYWPTAWLPPYVTQRYGINGRYYSQFGLPGHEGIDMRAPDGYDIFSIFEGEVYRVEENPVGAYGIQVRVRHETPEGIFKSIYAHFKKATVEVGDIVHKGSKLGDADNTGNSAGSHLHITLKLEGSLSWLSQNSTKPNEIINPTPYFPQIFVKNSTWRVVVGGNFRTAPKVADGNIIRYVKDAEYIQILEHRTEWLDWWKIKVGTTTGYFWEPGYKLSPA